jgi:ribosomal protein S18 acetylase RimI-like enzyme
MIDDSKYIIRKATLDDVEFIATVIIEAEKSMTNNLGLANFFELTEDEVRKYIIQVLEEEVDGCEFSLSSFFVAEYDGEPVSALGGWLEGYYDEMPSALLKSNLVGFVFPKENVLKTREKASIVKALQIEREMGTYQLENSYTKAEFRGLHIMGLLDGYHIDIAIKKGVKKIQAHVSKENEKSLRACERSGFHVVRYYTSHHPHVKDYYPDDTMVLLEIDL